MSRAHRILFLDDDDERARAFLAVHPTAVCVRTAQECLARLEEPWDEVHLDHDLGGEVYVDHDREDCGMAVVRWICERPRPHLKRTRFVVHSRNSNAACVMVLHLQVMGFDVRERPFGAAALGLSPGVPPAGRRRWAIRRRLMEWLRGLSR